jgi:uncharacterized SAM-binding protein YcdF (DUF218 family)
VSEPPRRPPLGAVGWAIRLVGLAGAAVFFVGAFTPLANALNARMAGVARVEPADAIVVVARGGTDADGVLTNRSLRRTLMGIELHRKGLAPALVFSGSDDEIDARTRLARGLGVPADHLLAARGARTTREEADVLAGLLRPKDMRRVLLVADPIDMPRTRLMLERRGLAVQPAPTASSGPGHPEGRLNLLRDLCVELTAWGYNRLAGRI